MKELDLQLFAKETDVIPDKGFSSFRKLKKHMGSPGDGKAWYHIVERSQIGKRANFTSQQGNNVNNIVAVPHGANSIHQEYQGIIHKYMILLKERLLGIGCQLKRLKNNSRKEEKF